MGVGSYGKDIDDECHHHPYWGVLHIHSENFQRSDYRSEHSLNRRCCQLRRNCPVASFHHQHHSNCQWTNNRSQLPLPICPDHRRGAKQLVDRDPRLSPWSAQPNLEPHHNTRQHPSHTQLDRTQQRRRPHHRLHHRILHQQHQLDRIHRHRHYHHNLDSDRTHQRHPLLLPNHRHQQPRKRNTNKYQQHNHTRHNPRHTHCARHHTQQPNSHAQLDRTQQRRRPHHRLCDRILHQRNQLERF